MRKTNTVILTLLVLLLAFFVSCSGTPSRDATAEDIAITLEIAEAQSTINPLTMGDYIDVSGSASDFKVTFTKDYSGTTSYGTFTLKSGTYYRLVTSSEAVVLSMSGSAVLHDNTTHSFTLESTTSLSSGNRTFSLILDGYLINNLSTAS